jgi:DNA-binding SARP family transcriptional activator/tetratricopeptide (TPR) repeat protein
MLFRMLGPLEVQVNGEWDGISAAKWRTVLAVLLVNRGQLVSTDELIGEVWPEDPPATATNLISVYVHRLRKQMGEDGRRLATRSPGYQLLAGPEDIDAGRFDRLMREGRDALNARQPQRAAEALSAAAALWHGTRALADVPPSPLISAEARRLEDCRVEALELRIHADLGCGRPGQVVPELRRLLTDHPLREGMWALLMRALQGSGRQAEALETYGQARQLISEELGVDPSAELRQLYEQILRADAGHDPISSATAPAADSPFAGPEAAGPVTPATAGPDQPVARDSAVPEGTGGEVGHPAVTALPLLAQLPADIPDFTGRAAHLDHLRELLSGPRRPDSPGAVVVAAVIGAGGLGKTTLAVHAAHQLRSQYPDGQLYANLQGASAHPAVPGEVLARFLRDLGMDPARIPADAEERAAQYRSRLTDRRVLIVLDDARDAAHVRPLLPGSASCAVLVTTRNRMPDLAGSRFVDLDVLQPGEARELFAGIVGQRRTDAEPAATAEVLAACAGLPLAIRIAGARLTARTSWSVASLARRLADQRRRLDELKTGDLAVRACFEVSFASLPGPQQPGGLDPAHAFRLLGEWQGPSIGLPAAAALFGQPEDLVAPALEVLVDAQLLQERGTDRYQFHDLLKAYAAERAGHEEPEPARQAALRRLLSWYVHSAGAVAQLISPQRYQLPLEPAEPGVTPLTFTSAAEAVAWCEIERANLVAATRQAASAGLPELAWRLPVELVSFFNRRGYWADWVATHRLAAEAAVVLGNKLAEAWVLNNLGMVFARHRNAQAVECFERALAIRHELGDRAGEAQAANNLADMYSLLGRSAEAIEPLERSLDLLRQAGDVYAEAVALNNLGEAYLNLGRTGEAIQALDSALKCFRQVGANRGEGYPLHNLGRAHLDRGDPLTAADCLNQALAIHSTCGDRYGEALTLKYLGTAEHVVGRAGASRSDWLRAQEIFTELGDEGQLCDLRALLSGGSGQKP